MAKRRSKKVKVFPVPSLGRELQCRRDIVSILRASTKYANEEIDDVPISSILFEYRNTAASRNGYVSRTLIPSVELQFIISKLNSQRHDHLIELVDEPVENILSYIYEVYKALVEAQPNIGRSNMMYNALMINGVPEYILMDAKQRSTTISRPWLILASVQRMSEMPQWWYTWVDKWALQWVYAPPKGDPAFQGKLMACYGNLKDVHIIESKMTIKEVQSDEK